MLGRIKRISFFYQVRLQPFLPEALPFSGSNCGGRERRGEFAARESSSGDDDGPGATPRAGERGRGGLQLRHGICSNPIASIGHVAPMWMRRICIYPAKWCSPLGSPPIGPVQVMRLCLFLSLLGECWGRKQLDPLSADR